MVHEPSSNDTRVGGTCAGSGESLKWAVNGLVVVSGPGFADVLCLCETLSLGKAGWSIYRNSPYYFYKLLGVLKYIRIKIKSLSSSSKQESNGSSHLAVFTLVFWHWPPSCALSSPWALLTAGGPWELCPFESADPVPSDSR